MPSETGALWQKEQPQPRPKLAEPPALMNQLSLFLVNLLLMILNTLSSHFSLCYFLWKIPLYSYLLGGSASLTEVCCFLRG